MEKIDVQKRVLQNGKPLDLNKFNWCSETRVFSSKENLLVIDFFDQSDCTFKTGWGCTFKTGSDCTFKTGSGCTFDTGSDCTFDTSWGCTLKTGSGCTFDTSWGCRFKTGSGCVIVRRGIFEIIQPNEGDFIELCPYGVSGHLVNGMKNGKLHIIVDGILFEVIKKRGNIYKVRNYGDDFLSYIVTSGDVSAHGKTIKEARKSLKYKTSDRDTSKYNSLTLDTELTLEECIKMYRTITGACEYGVRSFVESQDNVKDKYLVSEVVELTKGRYGNDTLVKFINKS